MEHDTDDSADRRLEQKRPVAARFPMHGRPRTGSAMIIIDHRTPIGKWSAGLGGSAGHP
jgi:hypothetical protein